MQQHAPCTIRKGNAIRRRGRPTTALTSGERTLPEPAEHAVRPQSLLDARGAAAPSYLRPSPRCAYGLEAFDVCCWCAGCDDCCCMLWCGPCALDQLARQEYLASNGYSVEYDFYAATGVVPGVQYARPPV